MEDKPKFAFVGNSHMAFWALNVYFPQWECLNYGAPGEGLAYVCLLYTSPSPRDRG